MATTPDGEAEVWQESGESEVMYCPECCEPMEVEDMEVFGYCATCYWTEVERNEAEAEAEYAYTDHQWT